VKETNKQLALS